VPFPLRRDDARFGELLAALAREVAAGAQLLAELLTADQAARESAAGRLHEVDQACEAAAHAVLRALAASYVTPLDRVDLYRLAWAMRTAGARMDAAGDELALFELGDLPPVMSQLVALVVRAADVGADAVPRLSRPGRLADSWTELNRLGRQAGQVHRRFLAEVTAVDGDTPVVVRRVAVAQSLRRVVEAFEDVAQALQTIAVREG
jgi:hypothetical protein